MSCETGPYKEAFKLEETWTRGPVLGFSRRIKDPTIKNNKVRTSIPPGMFGKPTETEIILEGKRITALLDTGSTVSTISKSFYTKELSHFIEMRHLNQILDIECAGGTQLPYEGYIEADIKTPGNSNMETRNIMLIVPDTQYSQHIPVLLGTNVLQSMIEHLKEEHGVRYLQTASLTTPWFMTLRCLTLREKG